jgi:ATP-dependent protease ClpP protease subunit
MLKKINLIIFQLVLVICFDIKKFTASLLLSSSLNNNHFIKENNYIPFEHNQFELKNNKIQLKNNNLEKENNRILSENSYIRKYSNSIRIINNDIYFYGAITSESCNELNDVLLMLDNELTKFSINFNINSPPINLHIQSEGGDLLDTFYIIDLIDNLKTPINTYVDGYVASAGSLISVMGKKRFMTSNSFIMIHQLSSNIGEGKFNDLDDNMNNLNKFMETIQNLYLKKTKIPKEILNNILEHDLWMNSKECLEYGLVDEIL